MLAVAAYAVQRVVWVSFYLYLSLLVLAVQVTVFYVYTVATYQREQQDKTGHSRVGRVGRNLANNPNYVHGTLLTILTITYAYMGLQALLETGYLPLLILIFAPSGILALPFYYLLTVRGGAGGLSNQATEDFRRRGRQRWVLEKHLARLIREEDGTDGFRSRVNARALEMLTERNDKTGEVVRELLADPDTFIEKYKTDYAPSQFWNYSFTLGLLELVVMMAVLPLLPGGILGEIWFILAVSVVLNAVPFCCWLASAPEEDIPGPEITSA